MSCGTVKPVPTPTYNCGTVCQHGRELDCDWASWTPTSNCLDNCAMWRDVYYYDLSCMSMASTCHAAEKCNETK